MDLTFLSIEMPGPYSYLVQISLWILGSLDCLIHFIGKIFILQPNPRLTDLLGTHQLARWLPLHPMAVGQPWEHPQGNGTFAPFPHSTGAELATGLLPSVLAI